MGYVIFNNINTGELPLSGVMSGVVVQTPPVYEFPTKKVDIYQIPGRNGDIVIDRNSYNNVNREYNIAAAFGGTDKSFLETARMLVDYMSSATGYARLEDSYEPNYFRMALFRSGGQLPNYYDAATAFVLKFECKPQRFLKEGETSIPITVDTGWIKEIVNQTNYVALPEISIDGTNLIITIQKETTPGSGLFETTSVFSIATATGAGCKIDSELKDCYNSTGYLNDHSIAPDGFPKLYPGKNKIIVTHDEGSITSVSVKPRWWVL